MKIKKIMALTLIIAIMISLLPTCVFAVDTTKLTISPNVIEAHPGDEITYTVKMGAIQNLAGMKFKLVIPDGLTFIEGKEVDGLQITLNAAKAEFTPATKVFVVGSSNYSSDSNTTLMTFKCSVNEGVVGDKEITFDIDEDDIFDTSANNNNIPVDYSNPGSKVTITPTPIPSTGISLNVDSISLEIGEEQTLVAVIEPEYSTDSVVWDSSDETKATIDQNGKVQAIAEGTTVISATTTSGQKASCNVTVTKPVCKHINKTTIQAKEPTCTVSGNNEYVKCNDCDKVFKTDGITETTIELETIAPLGHDFSLPRHDENQHWNECSRCGIADTKINHIGEGEYQNNNLVHWKTCGCGVKVDEEPHIAGTPVKENRHAATCAQNGSYDEVVYCSVCGYEMSRTPKIEEATGHVPGTPVIENVVPSTHLVKGTYDEVTYCSICGYEISREQKESDLVPHDGSDSDWYSDNTAHWKICGCGVKIDEESHIAGVAVKENRHAATCTQEGSYDEVIYCSVCGYEISRTQKIEEATGHVPGEHVIENEKAATCTEKGKYEEVVYCTMCNTELSRIEKEIDAKGHIEGEVVIENEKEATVDEEGSYDEVVYCTECNKELSRINKNTPKFVYEVLEGTASIYELNGQDTISIKINGKVDKFKEIKVDGNIVDKSNYLVKEGSTIITLKLEYLNTLTVGEHTITFVYDDGEVETFFKILNSSKNNNNQSNPKTGDASNIIVWIIGLAISGILFVVVTGCEKKGIRRSRQ